MISEVLHNTIEHEMPLHTPNIQHESCWRSALSVHIRKATKEQKLLKRKLARHLQAHTAPRMAEQNHQEGIHQHLLLPLSLLAVSAIS